jgi:hypothetical protein
LQFIIKKYFTVDEASADFTDSLRESGATLAPLHRRLFRHIFASLNHLELLLFPHTHPKYDSSTLQNKNKKTKKRNKTIQPLTRIDCCSFCFIQFGVVAVVVEAKQFSLLRPQIDFQLSACPLQLE